MTRTLRRVCRPSFLVLIAFASSASCGHKSETKLPHHLPFAYVQRDCGPTDGIASNFYFTQTQSKDGKYDEPYLEISIDGDLPRSAPRDYRITPGEYTVLASRCITHGKCDLATSGNLHLNAPVAGKSVSGEYELHFQDGSVETGAFDAQWAVSKVALLCG